MIRTLALLAALGVVVAGPLPRRALLQSDGFCSQAKMDLIDKAVNDPDTGMAMLWGDWMEYAGAKIRTYVAFDSQGNDPCMPAAVGLEFGTEMLNNLPSPTEVKNQPPASCATDPLNPLCFPPFDMMFLDFPGADIGLTPFKVFEFDWNPQGHTPGIYSTPHFDFHFYVTPKEEVMNITGGACMAAGPPGLSPSSFEEANQPVYADCFPGGSNGTFVNVGAATPGMGNHLVNVVDPEIMAFMHGGDGTAKFNNTWIWGIYGGQVSFFEVMTKRTYLLDVTELHGEIPETPMRYTDEGYYPTAFHISRGDMWTRVQLEEFQWYDGGCGVEDDMYAPQSFLNQLPNTPPLPAECVAPKPADYNMA